jgi:hypothetical protein
MALVSLTGALQSHNKPYRILNRANATSFKDLQQGPFILVGALNNEWTLRVTSGLRFSYSRQPSGGSFITDKQKPGSTSWSFSYSLPFDQPIRDYAIITRLRDPMTQQTGLIVAGLGGWGTQAAAEFVASPEHLRKLDAIAPRDWDRKNLQIVVGTDVIRGSSGPPIMIATHFW